MQPTMTKGEQVSNYLSNNNLTKTIMLLAYEMFLCKARTELVEEKITRCRQLFTEMENHSYTVHSVIRLQTSELDLISSLFMLLEDYLSYSHYLNATEKKFLPDKILDETTVTWKQILYLQNLSIAKTYDYLLLPSVKKTNLTSEEKRFVEETLKVFVNDIHNRINRITKFFVNYNRVYAKYKHVFSAMVGTYAIQENEKKPQIFVTDRVKYKKTNVTENATYVIPTTLEAFSYYEELKNNISTVFLSMLEAHIQSMQNCGQPFLMPDIYCIHDENKSRWLEITRKVNFFTGPTPNVKLALNVRQRSIPSMLKALSDDYIFKINDDILETTSSTLITDVPSNK